MEDLLCSCNNHTELAAFKAALAIGTDETILLQVAVYIFQWCQIDSWCNCINPTASLLRVSRKPILESSWIVWPKWNIICRSDSRASLKTVFSHCVWNLEQNFFHSLFQFGLAQLYCMHLLIRNSCARVACVNRKGLSTSFLPQNTWFCPQKSWKENPGWSHISFGKLHCRTHSFNLLEKVLMGGSWFLCAEIRE